jgi:hypothetical protein
VTSLLLIPAARAQSSPDPLSNGYTNAAYGFTLALPADFDVYPAGGEPLRDESGAPIGQAFVLQNGAGSAIQLETTQDTRETPSNVITIEEVAEAKSGSSTAWSVG